MPLTSERRAAILTLALPIVGGMLSQNVLNLVDTAMVGELGNAALGGIGMANFANFVSIAFITGLSAGVQAMVARRHGEQAHDQSAVPLNGGLLLALLIGLPIGVGVSIAAPAIFRLLTQDAEVGRNAAEYLRLRVLFSVFVGANFAFRGYWNGVSRSQVYFRTIVLMHVVNIALNYTLIFGHLGFPALGVRGAALGTGIATGVGFVLYTLQALKLARAGGFLRGLPSRKTLLTMLRIAGPAGLQNLFFAGGMLAFFTIVEKLGQAEAAASNVLVNLLLVLILPGIAFGLASASLVGQALGRKEPDDARRWAWDVVKLAAMIIGVLSIPPVIFPDVFLAPFLKDPETLALARWPLRVLMLGMVIDTTGNVLLNSLLGAGASRVVMIVAVGTQWFIFLPVAWLLGPVLGFGLTAIWVAQSGYRMLQTVIFVIIWQRGRWARIDV